MNGSPFCNCRLSIADCRLQNSQSPAASGNGRRSFPGQGQHGTGHGVPGETLLQVISTHFHGAWKASRKKLAVCGVQRTSITRIEKENTRPGKFLERTVEAA